MMPQKPPLERDEDEDGVPASREDEGAFEPDDDSDLGLDDRDDPVGLDSDLGIGEPLDGDSAPYEEDEKSWLDDTWGIAGDDPAGDGLEEDDEDSLIEGSEPAEGSRDEFDADELEPYDGETLTDAGEEGFGEDVLDDLEVEGLPPLDATEGEEAELDAELLAEESLIVADESGPESGRAAYSVDWSLMLDSGVPLDALHAVGAIGLAYAKGALFIAREGADHAECCFVAAGPARALSGILWRDALAIGVATPSGLLAWREGSARPEPLSVPADANGTISAVAWTEGERGPRLWAALAGGGLLASDDHGASFVSIRRDLSAWRLRPIEHARELLVLARGEGSRPLALRSTAAGESWLAIDLPVTEIERVQDLQACSEALLCCRRSPSPALLWRMGDGGWNELSPGASAPSLLVEEGTDLSAYFWLGTPRPRRLIRRVLNRTSANEVVGELPEQAGCALQLCGEHTDGKTTLQIGAERAWYRVRLALR